MSNSLLLRLFTSEYFNAWIAISYLFKYPDNVGIQHYLCSQLKKFPVNEIEFFLPQLIHILITRPTEAAAVEAYLVNACERSTHMAIMSLWYLQAYLSDLSTNPTNPSFQLCKRVLNRCQAILFAADNPLEEAQRVHEHVAPAFVGIGALLAAIGLPAAAKPIGNLAIAQGRMIHFHTDEDHVVHTHKFTATLEDLHRGKAFARLRRSRKITLVSHDENAPSQLLTDMESMKVMAQSSVPTSQDVMSLPQSPVSRSSSFDEDRVLLRSNYFRSEMQFLLALVDIATRLVIVPKPARQSALHAELTLLNHNLPAEICLPLWCPATDDRPFHHRVVRISPTDAVVLNSAERAPYLLMIEVLDDELSLDPLNQSKQCQTVDLDPPIETEETPVMESDTSAAPLPAFDAEEFAEKMKTAAILLAQLQHDPNPERDTIRQKIIAEMVALEEDRLAKMTAGIHVDSKHTLDYQVALDREDPSAAVFSESWSVKRERIRASSPYGHLPNWRLISVIVKHGADLRQEQLAVQLIREMQKIWQDTHVDVWVQYIRVLVTSDHSGLIETVKNSISIHSIKKEAYTKKWNEEGSVFTLKDYYIKKFGPEHSEGFKRAQDAFMRSLAGYSIACYLMQIKDRHNGNLLIDDQGHIVHIDFGFILSNSPGSVGFEMAPFKLPQEYLDLLGNKFGEYKSLMKAAFLAVVEGFYQMTSQDEWNYTFSSLNKEEQAYIQSILGKNNT
ncbi:Putative Atypical/PI4K protein kinase [Rhizopus microsporus]|nr:Putative Atypical/PI4K protein kinase [Rhizopus microsporus]